MRTFLPYLAPFFGFLLVKEFDARTGESLDFACLVASVVVPVVAIVYFATKKEYPELSFSFGAMTVVDLGLGVALAVMWIAPFVIWPAMRPEASDEFDPAMFGTAAVTTVLTIRMIGYAIVTPVMEELFMRSFLIRFAEVWDEDRDFRELPIGKFTWKSFAAVVVIFLATHVSWEWPVMLPWAVLTTLWFYYRKDLMAVIMTHAATNAAILLAAIFLDGTFDDGSGGGLSLWFLV